ncbi:hypothetical protein B0T22DRAFT_445004 [Podospora appendiculata]|uniref:Tyrosinase copper-binding domain-containing protein n=1 Tax=Podospora appendiculata TaxID=314037 RepID=A0AAE0X1P4_9PEZI|nr:hypothetical protein B0T22DRAFT_445004 [Podospora appendiculata]
MRLTHLSALAIQVVSLVAAAGPADRPVKVADPFAQLDDLAKVAYQRLEAEAKTQEGGNTCNWKNVKIRREWGALTKPERRKYIAAVKCLQSKPARYPASLVPGAKSRFDDFVAVHINQTQTIHYTGNFLGWHRYFTWLYEQALQVECGYTGTQPYWDWSKTAVTGLAASPIWDGSDTSMSGNGAFIPNQGEIVLGNIPGSNLPPIYLPAGTGGGCITSGPFVNMTVNMGPVSLALPGGATASNPDGPLAYNPRCLKRDLTDAINSAFSNATATLALLTQTSTVADFQMQMQGIPGTGNIGVHGGGHYSFGGDPGRDVFVSPGDPAFYLLHGNIDRTWWMWQMQDPAARVHSAAAVGGTVTFLNNPPSANATVEDWVDYEYAAGPARKLGELMSTVAGPFCYVYL